jgi:hypothetical protein
MMAAMFIASSDIVSLEEDINGKWRPDEKPI